MKKLITLTVLSTVILILLIVGITQRVALFDKLHGDVAKVTGDAIANDAYINKTPTVIMESPAVIFSILSIVWLFVIVLTIPLLKLKSKSIFLNFVIIIQIILAPVAVILTPIYLAVLKYGKGLSGDMELLQGGVE
ncbi:hypothetical protein [Mycoplasma todarodis]|uniref:Uncharacterized protein n=1 Tax=Mycoplasma todarodis TaxID=1937191 RepID=A0A4R0XKX0_9MOLU|nr:hypothetical protein [Mycoplasma todarodis]TCG11306.1 hypothetical protein C4B25_01835 [Mycoplasma todarodis]